MARFGVVAQYDTGAASMIGRIDEKSYTHNDWRPAAVGISLIPNPFTCCGLGTLTGFGRTALVDEVTRVVTFENKANFIAAIYTLTAGRTHFVFVVNPTQKHGDDFKVMVEAGAKCIAKFPNNQGGSHSGYNLEMYLWNPNDAIGIFVDSYGVARTAPVETKTPKTPVAPPAPPMPASIAQVAQAGQVIDRRPARF